MEFIINVLIDFIGIYLMYRYGLYMGRKSTNNQFQHPNETPKVSINKAKKEFCECKIHDPFIQMPWKCFRCKKDIKGVNKTV